MANVYEKLNHARLLFLKYGARKTGKNFSIGYNYFELEDIVPAATEIFNEVGLISIVSVTEDRGMICIMNTEQPTPEESINFMIPMRFADTNKGTNAVQALGSSLTYIRRYLYMVALDIVEADSIENAPKEEQPVPPPAEKAQPVPAEKAVKKPTKKAKKEEPVETAEPVAEEPTAPEQASAQAIANLKELCGKLLDIDPEQEDFVQQLADMTSGFTVITSAQAETITSGLVDLINQY